MADSPGSSSSNSNSNSSNSNSNSNSKNTSRLLSFAPTDLNHAADYRIAPASLPLLHDSPLPLNLRTPLALDLELARPAALPRTFGPDPPRLSLSLTAQSPTRLCLQIQNAEKTPWRVPSSIVPRHPAAPTSDPLDLQYSVFWADNDSFSPEIRRESTGERLFGGKGMGLTMKDQFLEFSTRVGSEHGGGEAHLFGLGENVGRFRRQPGTVTTLWARDCPCNEGDNLYGSHPFYLEVLPSGRAHGVLLMSSNGMDILLSPIGDTLTYRVIGGSIELYVLTGPSPQDVVQQYTELIGRPCMPPFWSLGMGQCRWGYDTLDMVKAVVAEYRRHDLPLESIWIDIDYMDEYKCFTLDENRFPLKEFAAFMEDLRAHDQHLVMILDPGIKLQYEPGLYEPYDEGVAKNLFIKRKVREGEQFLDGKNRSVGDLVDFVGKVWPGKTTFPDWFHPDAQSYWIKYISEWYRKIPFSGLWIDMNENASFHNGDCSHIESSEDRPVQLSDFSAAEPKDDQDEDLEGVMVQPQHQQQPQHEHAKSTTIRIGNGLDDFEDENFRVRSNRGHHLQPKDTIAIQERIHDHDPQSHHYGTASVSPSSAEEFKQNQGQGVLAQKKPPVVYQDPNHPPYRINNNSEYADLDYRTISADAVHHGGILEYDAHNLSGHMEGIATYAALRTLEPSKKPFILSRSTFVGSGQYVVKWLGDNWSRYSDMRASIAGLLNFQLFGISMVGADVGGFGDTASEELLIRWHQLGTFYPFVRNHNCIVNPPQEPYTSKALTDVARTYLDMRYRLLPFWYTLFHRSHRDGHMVCSPLWILNPSEESLLKTDDQFLVGTGVLVSPVLEPGQSTVNARFPPGRWYDLHSGLLEVFVQPDHDSRIFEIEAPLSKIPLHLRGGHILPCASIEAPSLFLTTAQARKAPLEVVVALDDLGRAAGEYYHDDDSFESLDGTLVKMRARPGVLTLTPTRAIDANHNDEEGQEETVPFSQPPGVRSSFVSAVTIWGVGLDKALEGQVQTARAGSSSKVDPRLVRISIVRRPETGTATAQHQRDLRAVPRDEAGVTWSAETAQLRIVLKRAGGLEVRGNEAFEIDWADALMA